MLIRESFPVGPLQCNCTIVACDESKEAVVIDPGGDCDKIIERLKYLDVRVTKILHTHAHFDHVGATQQLFETTGALRYLHEEDMDLYQSVEKQCSFFGISVDSPDGVEEYLKDGMKIDVGQGSCNTIHCPGHTKGSCGFHFESLTTLAAGDTMFLRGIGRTDLWGGDFPTIQKSIVEKLYVLPPETIVIAGHGPETTIGDELKNNPKCVY